MSVKKLRLSVSSFAAVAFAAIMAPMLAFAQAEEPILGAASDGDGAAADQINETIVAWLNAANTLVALLMALAVAAFFWGLVKFLFKIGGEDGSDDGKRIMIWGVVALFVMVSLWGIIGFLGNQFNIKAGDGAGFLDSSRYEVVNPEGS